jgi:hypothetical protein
MKNEETKWQGMNVFCSIITRIRCFGKQKKNLGEIDEAVGGEKGIPDPDSLCCNYRADCNGSAAVSA